MEWQVIFWLKEKTGFTNYLTRCYHTVSFIEGKTMDFLIVEKQLSVDNFDNLIILASYFFENYEENSKFNVIQWM